MTSMKTTPENYENYILPLLDKLSREKKDILIMGDFNINLLNYKNDKETTTFLDIMFPTLFHA